MERNQMVEGEPARESIASRMLRSNLRV